MSRGKSNKSKQRSRAAAQGTKQTKESDRSPKEDSKKRRPSLADDKPYDKAVAVLITEYPSLLISMVNEFYGFHFSPKSKVTVLNPKHKEDSEKPSSITRITDAVFQIDSPDDEPDAVSEQFIMEFETAGWSGATDRALQYGFEHAYANRDKTNSSTKVKIPYLGVMAFRGSEKTPRRDNIEVECSGAHVKVLVPVEIRTIKHYTKEEIIDKGLYFLIPFWAFHYSLPKDSDDLSKEERAKAQEDFDAMICDYRYFFTKLKEAAERDEVSPDTGGLPSFLGSVARLMLDLTGTILDAYTEFAPVSKKEVNKLTDATSWDFPSLKLKHGYEALKKEKASWEQEKASLEQEKASLETNSQKLNQKFQAAMMKLNGLSNAEIAKNLGIKVATVQEWLGSKQNQG